MKIYKVIRNGNETNRWTSEYADETHYEPGFGKPERWIRADQLDQQNEDINQALESREVDNGLETYTEYKFVAEYTIQTVDLSQDYDYLLQECHKNRLSEYPSLGDFADAYVKMQNGDSTQMAAYTAKCNEVKTKYPKPVQS